MFDVEIRGNWAFVNRKYRTKVFGVMVALEDHKGFTAAGEFRFRPTDYNIRILKEKGVNIINEDNSDDLDWEDSIDQSRPKYDPPKTFFDPVEQVAKEIHNYQHQSQFHEAFKDLRKDNAFVGALFAEMGTGKTKMAIDKMNYHFCMNRIDAVIVLAKKGVHEQWAIPETNGDGEMVSLAPIRKFTQSDIGADCFVWGVDKLENGHMPELMLAKDNRLKWVFFTFEAHTSERAKKALREFASAHKGRLAFVGDETHKLKTPTARRTKFATNVASVCCVRLIMTGTPIAKNLIDEYSQLKVIAPSILGHKFVTSFKNEFCRLGGFNQKQVVGARNLDKFKQITGPYVFRVTKKECIDLPEKQYGEIRFDMSKEQKDAIKSLKTVGSWETPLGHEVKYETPMGILAGIQQISNGFLMTEGEPTYIFKNNPRIETLRSIVDDSDEKFVVWARYHEDMNILHKEFGDSAAFYYGPLSPKQRAAEKDSFMDPDGPRLLCLTTSTGAEGIDGLQRVASTAVYYSNTFNSIERWQSEDRIHRIGMGDKAYYIDLIARGSVDSSVLRNLRAKKALADLVLDIGREIGIDIDDLFHLNKREDVDTF